MRFLFAFGVHRLGDSENEACTEGSDDALIIFLRLLYQFTRGHRLQEKKMGKRSTCFKFMLNDVK